MFTIRILKRVSYHLLQLFTASGVVESRASTRLGEIVKLLTYVSIFYLPLTFSTVSMDEPVVWKY